MTATPAKKKSKSVLATPATRQRRNATAKGADYLFRIGDLSREFDVTLRTLRFYEDRGLITPRRSGTTRLYDETTRQRLATILRGKALGFTLTEIGAMLEGDGSGEASNTLKLTNARINDQFKHLERRKAEIEAAIRELRRSQSMVARVAG